MPLDKANSVLDPDCICDVCREDLSGRYRYDAATRPHGHWAVLCAACFLRIGYGLGQGRGEKFDAYGQKVAG